MFALKVYENDPASFQWRLGVDIGQKGALALFDGKAIVKLWDMPVIERKVGKGLEVDSFALCSIIKAAKLLASEKGHDIIANIEYVSAQPIGGQKMGTTSAFNFGDSFGVVRGVLSGAGIRYRKVQPMIWKRSVKLVGKDKQAARLLAIKYFPYLKQELRLKKNVDRADAIFIGLSL